jgi:type I restriction enzyme S subunit
MNTETQNPASIPKPKNTNHLSEWRKVKLGDLGIVITGKTPSSRFPDEFGNTMPFITPTDYKNYNKWIETSERYLSEKGIKKLKNKIIPPNSVLVTCIGSDMGKVAMNKVNVVTNQQINSIIPNDKINPDFLYYKLIESYDILRTYGEAGTAVPIVNKSDFEKIKIIIPECKKLQTAIAEVLSSLDDKIDLLHRQNKTLEALAETIFRQWFIEEADERWQKVPLEKIGRIVCGKTPSKKISEYFNGNIPFIKIPDMHGKTFVFDTEDSLTVEGLNSQPNKTIPPKSICVSCIATVGLVAMNAKLAQTNQQINSIIPSKDIYRYFIYLKMRSMKEELLAMASGGTATDNLNTTNFSKITIEMPDDITLIHFHEKINPIFEKIYTNQTQIRTLTQLRDTLLPKLMSGEVRVDF